MNIELLKQKIEEGEGKWVAKEDFIFTQEKDGTIYAKCNRENEVGTAFLMEHSKGNLSQFYIQSGCNLGDINKNIRFAQMLNNILKIGVNIESITEKEIEVEVEKIVKDDKQSGMIEAYEKLLLGKKITLE